MRKNLRVALTTGAVVAALLSGPVFNAYSADSPASTGAAGKMAGMMHDGGMPGMMNMMQQMNQMMDACNTMMKDMHQQRRPDTPKEHKMPSETK